MFRIAIALKLKWLRDATGAFFHIQLFPEKVGMIAEMGLVSFLSLLAFPKQPSYALVTL